MGINAIIKESPLNAIEIVQVGFDAETTNTIDGDSRFTGSMATQYFRLVDANIGGEPVPMAHQ